MVRAMLSILLGSLALLGTCSSATREKKVHDKRQAASLMFYPQKNRFQSQYPAYFPSPGYYQYNPSLTNSGHTMQSLALPQQQPFDASSPYSQTSRAQPHGRYTSYFYPHQTHFKDWSRKVLQANNYARKWQTARNQELLLRNQNTNQGGGGVKFFAAGVDKNGNMQGKWIGRTQFQKLSDGNNYSAMNVNVGTLSNSPPNSKSMAQLVANPPTSHSSNQQGNPVSTYTNLVTEPVNSMQQSQTSSFHDKATKTNANSNHSIFSDNLGGAVLGPNAHSLLQWAASQKAPDSSSLENHQGGVGTTGNNNTNQFPDTNVPSNKILGQKQSENILSDNEHHTSVSMLSVQGNPNPEPLKNPLSSPLGANLPTKLGQLKPGNTTGVTKSGIKNLPLDTRNVDKTTAKMLNSRLTSISASRPQSESTNPQRSASSATPNNNEVATRNSALGKKSANEAMINSELALKNILFPPPSATRNQPSGSTRKSLKPQQIVPSFPAFRFDENRPAADQQPNYNINPRGIIAHPLTRKSLVPRTKPMPYKGSFPLMLHKISPYFKMKRNLKQMANGQAKARRRFLELQTIKR